MAEENKVADPVVVENAEEAAGKVESHQKVEEDTAGTHVADVVHSVDIGNLVAEEVALHTHCTDLVDTVLLRGLHLAECQENVSAILDAASAVQAPPPCATAPGDAVAAEFVVTASDAFQQ